MPVKNCLSHAGRFLYLLQSSVQFLLGSGEASDLPINVDLPRHTKIFFRDLRLSIHSFSYTD